MINGMDVFLDYFVDYVDQYVLIGGSACEMVMEDKGLGFRATADLDVVLIVEALTPVFAKRFFQFIKDGGYENRLKSNGKPQFYRFDKPKDNRFPVMIELLARVDGLLLEENQVCGPIHISDTIYSLSAILLNDSYYELLLKGRTIINGISVLNELYLIPFKAKAYLDLSERKANGENIKSEDIKKHRKDIIRLITVLLPNVRCELNYEVKKDMKRYIDDFVINPIEPRVIGYKSISVQHVIEILTKTYI